MKQKQAPHRPRAPRLTIQITPERIEESKERDSSHCMIAEAVKAAYPGASRVSVDLQTIRFTDPQRHHRYTYLTPRTAQLSLIDFDQGDTPAPFSFVLRGGHVTYAGSQQTKRLQRALADGAEDDAAAAEAAERNRRVVTDAQRAASRANSQKAMLARQVLVSRAGEVDPSGKVPDRVGGAAPPVGKVRDPDGRSVPFARRRAFGLRALAR